MTSHLRILAWGVKWTKKCQMVELRWVNRTTNKKIIWQHYMRHEHKSYHFSYIMDTKWRRQKLLELISDSTCLSDNSPQDKKENPIIVFVSRCKYIVLLYSSGSVTLYFYVEAYVVQNYPFIWDIFDDN